MKMLAKWMLLLSVLVLAGCERVADVSKPQGYDKGGIRFSYPANWKVSDDTEEEGVRNVIVESSADSIFVVQAYPRSVAFSLNDYAQNISDEIGVSLPVGKQENVRFARSRTDVKGGQDVEAIDETADLNMLGQRVPLTRSYYRIDGGDRVLLMFHQSTAEDQAKVSPGFDLILQTVQLTPAAGS